VKLAGSEIHVWLAFDGEFQEEAALRGFEALLAPDERAARERLRAPGLPRQFLVTRAMLRSALSAYAPEVAAADWRFAIAEHGKPLLAPDFGATGLHFNIAHTAGLVAIAISRQPSVGVDVEYLGGRRPPLDVAPRYFSDTEARELAALAPADQPLRFYALWTLKESWLKATGEGLAGGLDRIAFSFRDLRHADGVRLSGDDPAGWRFWQAKPSDNHLLALALRGPLSEVRVRMLRAGGAQFDATETGALLAVR
jgi:4'-phosphopantetheinyl transferase